MLKLRIMLSLNDSDYLIFYESMIYFKTGLRLYHTFKVFGRGIFSLFGKWSLNSMLNASRVKTTNKLCLENISDSIAISLHIRTCASLTMFPGHSDEELFLYEKPCPAWCSHRSPIHLYTAFKISECSAWLLLVFLAHFAQPPTNICCAPLQPSASVQPSCGDILKQYTSAHWLLQKTVDRILSHPQKTWR